MIDNKKFEELWEKEERQAVQQRLQHEYPAWRQRRRVRRTALASVAVLLAVVLPTIHYPLPTKQYDSVACNRSGFADAHWAEVASHVLTVQAL